MNFFKICTRKREKKVMFVTKIKYTQSATEIKNELDDSGNALKYVQKTKSSEVRIFSELQVFYDLIKRCTKRKQNKIHLACKSND